MAGDRIGSEERESADIQKIARDFHHHDEALDDIFDVYRQLRERCPVGCSERYEGFYFAAKYEDIFRVEQNPETSARLRRC